MFIIRLMTRQKIRRRRSSQKAIRRKVKVVPWKVLPTTVCSIVIIVSDHCLLLPISIKQVRRRKLKMINPIRMIKMNQIQPKKMAMVTTMKSRKRKNQMKRRNPLQTMIKRRHRQMRKKMMENPIPRIPIRQMTRRMTMVRSNLWIKKKVPWAWAKLLVLTVTLRTVKWTVYKCCIR